MKARLYDWIKLALENWKTVASLLTLVAALVSSGVGNVLQGQEVKSYRSGYEALAHNVSVAQGQPVKQLAEKPTIPQVQPRTYEKELKAISSRLTEIENKYKILSGFHALN